MQSSYLMSAQKATQLPHYTLPEVAFIGRSNCGKSSLLNSLTGRKNLARQSSTPGRTQMVNFFKIELAAEAQLIFADLPGYGFNVARKEIRKLWDSLLETYLKRSNICEFLYLMDIRRDFEDFELSYMRHLGSAHPLILVLTKADKIKVNAAQTKKQELGKQLTAAGIAWREIFVVSNLDKKGIDSLRELLFSHAGQDGASASEA